MSDSKSSMSWNENQDLGDYRTINKAALAAILLSLFSFVAFTSPVFWLLPIFGLMMAALALHQIRSNASFAGGSVAATALMISTFVAIAAPVRHVSRQRRLVHIGRQHVDKWVGLVKQGNLPQALELTLHYTERNPVGADLDKIYGPIVVELAIEDPAQQAEAAMSIRTKEEELRQFFGRGAAKIIASTDAQPKFLRMVASERRSGMESIKLQYEMTVENQGVKEKKEFEFELERMFHADLNESHWRIKQLHMETTEAPVMPKSVKIVAPARPPSGAEDEKPKD